MSHREGWDLSGGAENLPVVVEAEPTDSKFLVTAFQYTPENVPGPGCHCHPNEVTFPGCDCRSASCQQGSCSCLQAHGQVYDNKGRLREHEQGDYSRPVFECSALCGCGETCINRVVQQGLRFRLSVFSTQNKGWGVRALEPIPCGTFVCEYAGEVLGYEEACQRQRAQGPADMNYIMALREHTGQGRVCDTFVDPAAVGNVGRFLNHSCQPNLMMVPVRVHSLVPRLALFALRNIAAGEELTFDYSGTRSTTQGLRCTMNPVPSKSSSLSSSSSNTAGTDGLKRKPCHCGAHNCSQFLPLDMSVIDTC
ncbi:histone-lysine N-methyltransferase SETMAR [Arapaima gigas]